MSTLPNSILTEAQDGILLITINRPEMRNAFDRAAAEQMEMAMDRLDETPELFIGVITGAGGAFSVGADLRAVSRGEWPETKRRGAFGIFRQPSRKPLIAAVEGYAVGGGMELCLACDIIVAAETARFGLPEVKHNLVAIGGGLIRLQHRVPYNIAMEMALTGAIKEAAFLHQWGFVNKLCAHDTALATAMAFARSLLANGPTALAASKEIMFRSRSWADEAEAWDKQSVIAERAIKSDDFKEGLAAFAEKRKPIWKGS